MKTATSQQTPIRSYAEANRELMEAFCRYLLARGQAAPTIRSYRDSVTRLVESLGSESIVGVERSEIRVLLAKLYGKGLAENSIRLHTAALRNFYKYLRLTGLTKHDPTLLLAQRKLPGRLPIVLTMPQVEALIGTAHDPFERAVPEVLYATGVRVSELVQLRIENIDFAEHVILVKKGKGGKDRHVLFGALAAKALQEYLAWRQRAIARDAIARLQRVLRPARMGRSWGVRGHRSQRYQRKATGTRPLNGGRAPAQVRRGCGLVFRSDGPVCVSSAARARNFQLARHSLRKLAGADRHIDAGGEDDLYRSGRRRGTRALIDRRTRKGWPSERPGEGKKLGRPKVVLDASRIAALRSRGLGWKKISNELGLASVR